MKTNNNIIAGLLLCLTLPACTYSTDDGLDTADRIAEAQNLLVEPAPLPPDASNWEFIYSESAAFPHETIVLGEYCSGNKFENNPSTSLTTYLTAFDHNLDLTQPHQDTFIEIRGLQANSNIRCVLSLIHI